MTPKAYEKKVAAEYRKAGFTVARADDNNYMPDFVVFNDKHLFFVECKRYLSCRTPQQVIRRVHRNQAGQMKRFAKISPTTPILIRFMLKGGVETTATIYKNEIKYSEPFRTS